MIVLTFLALLMLPTATWASPLEILASPQSQPGDGWGHNIFHDAGGTTTGSFLAWFDLDKTETNFYDPDNGILQAFFRVYEDSTLSVNVGRVRALGALPAANFNQNTDNIIGALDWTFNLSGPSTLNTYLENTYGVPNIPGSFEVTMTYTDTFYDSVGGRPVNSWENGHLSLWGGDGYDEQLGEYTNIRLGNDFVLSTIPEPTSMLLFSSGLLGSVVFRRRKKK